MFWYHKVCYGRNGNPDGFYPRLSGRTLPGNEDGCPNQGSQCVFLYGTINVSASYNMTNQYGLEFTIDYIANSFDAVDKVEISYNCGFGDVIGYVVQLSNDNIQQYTSYLGVGFHLDSTCDNNPNVIIIISQFQLGYIDSISFYFENACVGSSINAITLSPTPPPTGEGMDKNATFLETVYWYISIYNIIVCYGVNGNKNGLRPSWNLLNLDSLWYNCPNYPMSRCLTMVYDYSFSTIYDMTDVHDLSFKIDYELLFALDNGNKVEIFYDCGDGNVLGLTINQQNNNALASVPYKDVGFTLPDVCAYSYVKITITQTEISESFAITFFENLCITGSIQEIEFGKTIHNIELILNGYQGVTLQVGFICVLSFISLIIIAFICVAIKCLCKKLRKNDIKYEAIEHDTCHTSTILYKKDDI